MLAVSHGIVGDDTWKRELSTLARYLAFAFTAGPVTFALSTTPPQAEGEYAAAINIGEAWKY